MREFGLLARALIASMLTSVAVEAQEVTSAEWMVHAFRDYCIDTDPTRFRTEIPKILGDWKLEDEDRPEAEGIIYRSYTLLMVRNDPHSRLTLEISWTNGKARVCTVNAVWPKKSEVIRALSASVVLGKASSTLGDSSEITSWTIPVHGTSAVVELRVPTNVAEPGGRLALILRR